MNETVYMLGAGFNYSFTHFDGLRPPLAMNFFEVLLSMNSILALIGNGHECLTLVA
jgi:hypothetical protein